MTAVIDDVLGDAFSTKSSLAADRISVQLVGCLDLATSPFLRHFLNQLTRSAQAGELLEFEFDIAQLYLMSSSSISHLASWLKGLRALEPVRRVTFRTNPKLSWQQRSLDALRRVAEPLVKVE
jgi:hypothetical protein